MLADASILRAHLASRREEIALAHRRGASSFDSTVSLTRCVDEAVRMAFDALPPADRSHLAILALGGYGRAELCPFSDVDVMVLRADGRDRESAGKAAKAFLHLLWDAGIDIGHSVRTIGEALSLHGHSIDAWNSMLESRRVCGDERLASDLHEMMAAKAGDGPDRWAIGGILAAQRALHERHGNSVKLLEPNIKKSAGGLRDIHTAYWLYRSHAYARRPEEPVRAPALKEFCDDLVAEGTMDAEERDAALGAVEFLLRIRHEMHLQRGTLHDTLEYVLQLKVAEALGYADRSDHGRPGAPMRAVELFMRDYYLQARTLHTVSERLTHRFREIIEPVRRPEHARETLGGIFFLHGDVLSVAPEVTRFDSAGHLLEVFVIAAEKDCDLDFRLRAVVERSLDLITEEARSSPVLASMFRRILNSGRVGATLRAMNDLNLLGTYLPEFGRLVAFFQHNVYHYFTADEHTIIALANAESLRDRQGLLHDVFRLLPRREVLYMAVLLHDIAKPDGVSDHEVTGVAVAERVLARLGMSEIFPDVAFLIRHHLMMEQVAFRRNIHDPGTIREFAARFDRPDQLDYLFVLTYADLSAVNTNVWTEWKSAILQELYGRTAEVLRRNLRGDQIDAFHRAKRESAVEHLVAKLLARLPEDEVLRHVRGMQNDSYFAVFSEEEIARHVVASGHAGSVDAAFTPAEGHTEITVIARDAPFALSRFCAVLAANDANIFDANIFTRDDGIIIDRFRVSDAASGLALEQRVCAKITEDLRKVMEGTLDVEHLFAEHRRKWKRRPRAPVNPSIRTDVVFEEAGRFAIIEVYAADSVGFLYRITETMSRIGIDIYFAKIATRVDGIVDAFYVLDRDGQSLRDPGRREAIRSELLSTIRRMGEEQLS